MPKPKAPDPRTKYIMVRVSGAEKRLIHEAAERQGKPMSEWVRETLLRRAKRA